MEESPEGNIREKIAGRTSEMCIAAMVRIPSRRYQLIYIFGLLLSSLNIEAIIQ